MKQDTPYRELSGAEQSRELVCMRTVLADAAAPKLIYEAFGGVGMTAALMRELWPRAAIHSWELDPQCVEVYRARKLPNATITKGDTRYAGFTKLFDAASLDFNQFTILDLTRRAGKFQFDLIGAALRPKPKWLQLTDSAVSHLHLNWAKYDIGGPVWEEYVQRLSAAMTERFGYRIVSSAHHRRASYFRLETGYG